MIVFPIFYFLYYVSILIWCTPVGSQCRFDIGILVFIPRVIPATFLFKLLLFNPSVFLFPPLHLYLFHFFFGVCNLCFTSYRVSNAEVLCLGLVSVAVFMLVMPLFKRTGAILLQMAPPSIPSSALSKCWRQVILFFLFSIFEILIR